MGIVIISVSLGLAIAYHNIVLLGIILIVLLPTYVLVILTPMPRISVIIRVVIALCMNFVASAVIYDIIESSIILWLLLEFFILVLIAVICFLKTIIQVLRKKRVFEFIIPIVLIVFSIFLNKAILGYSSLDFYWRLNDYKTIIQLVNNEELKPNSRGEVYLPFNYEYLSVNGSAQVFKDDTNWSIIFYDFPNRGYLYSPISKPPERLSGGCKELLYQNFWFYCVDYG